LVSLYRDGKSYYFRAKLKYFKEDYESALKDINIAIRLNSKEVDNYVARAKIYLSNDNEYDDALAEDDLYTAIKMGSDEAQELLEDYFSEAEE
jgi:tetratricopeptide (TPR) repeat protein